MQDLSPSLACSPRCSHTELLSVLGTGLPVSGPLPTLSFMPVTLSQLLARSTLSPRVGLTFQLKRLPLRKAVM